MNKGSKNNGITLIALAITIIVLLILAGVTINLTLGQNGIFKTAERAATEHEYAQLKEELELEIFNIQTRKIAEGKELKREDLSELSNIGAIIECYTIPAEGEYKNYFFEIDEKYGVTIVGKIKGEKPTITGEVITEGIVSGGNKVEIKVSAGITEGTITSIEATNGAKLKTSISETEKIFEVSESGSYYFKTTAENGRTAVLKIDVNNIVPKYYLYCEGEGEENWTFKTGRGTTLEKRDDSIYMYGASISGDAQSGHAMVYLTEMIDLTGYSKLYVEIEAKTTMTTNGPGTAGVTNNPEGEWRTPKNGTYVSLNSDGRIVYEYTIPDEFGEYSPCVRVGNGFSGTWSEVIVYNVWLEE